MARLATAKISASILGADFSRLAGEARSMEKAGCDFVHIDVMDGVYVPRLTFGEPVVRALKECATLPLDVHLMVVKPEDHVEVFASVGAHCISFHPDATCHPHRLVEKIKSLGCLAGIVFNPGFSPSWLAPLMALCDRVMVMTVNPGSGGQALIPSQLDVVRTVRSILDGCSAREIDVAVDGGVDRRTARACIEAGASVLVVGQAFFGAESRPEFVKHLKSL